MFYINDLTRYISLKEIENTNKLLVKELNKLKDKQDLMMDYIDNIEVVKNNGVIKMKNINFRKTFIEEYANLFNNGAINRYQDILVNDKSRQIEISKPMTRNEISNYLKKLQTKYPIFDYLFKI